MVKKFCLVLFLLVLVGAIYTVFPFPRVSYELQSSPLSADPAPNAATPELRIALWLKKYAPLIRAQADKYHVSPVAIAGVIAWEGMKNEHIRHMPYSRLFNYILTKGLIFQSMGPGKVQAWPRPDLGPNAATFLEGNARYTPLLPALPPSFLPVPIVRALALRDPATSIGYIAAIMNAYAIDAEEAGYKGDTLGIRDNPGVLATFFSGVHGYSLPQAKDAFAARMKDKGNAPFQLNVMGRWVAQPDTVRYLKDALGLH